MGRDIPADLVNLMNSDEKEIEDRRIIERLYQTVRKSKKYKELLGSMDSLAEDLYSSETAKDFMKPYAQSLQKRFKRSGERGYRFKEISKLYDGELVTLLKTFVYLGLFETSITNIIDLILMFFISLDHDFYIPWTRKYARKLEDLDDASLGEKLAFLNKHSLQVFSQNINKNLRNKIAHMDFDIEPDGKISVGDQKYDLEKEIYELMAFLLTATAALEDSGISKFLRELS